MRPDILLMNAHVLTINPAQPTAQALAIARGRIAAIGSDAEIHDLAGPGTSVVNLNGRMVVPGFNDCHMHILPYGLDLAQADLSPAAGVTDVPGLIAALRRWAEANPQSEWALGNRYEQNAFPGAAHPTRYDLDAAFPDRPVYITQTSKHASVANSAALRRAGVTRETPDPEGGEIVRDASGEPTGILLESAMSLVARHIPKPDRTGLVAAIKRANDALVAKGVTAAADLNTGWHDLDAEIACYRQAADEGAPVRMTLLPHARKFGRPQEIPAHAAFSADLGFASPLLAREGQGGVRLGPAKLFSDGALTVRTAALREPYADGSGLGMLLHEPEELRGYVLAAHLGGWQIAIHAIGDRAIELALDCYLKASALAPFSLERGGTGGEGHRHRIEHAMLLDAGLIRRLKAQRVLPVMQPEFISRLGDAYVLGLGEERAARLNPVASLQRAGIGVPFSSDCPIVPGAPLDGIRAAVRRTTRSGRLLSPEERIAPLDALRNYTYWAAYSTFDEGETGTVQPGKRADLTILDCGSRIADGGLTEESLDSAQVTATMIGGEIAWGALE